MEKTLKLGLFGFGCVGQGLYHVLHETRGIKADIKKICVKHPEKPRLLPKEYFTLAKEDILNDPEIDVVVELIDDAVAAFAIVKQALQNGKHVVTANKKMLAENLEEIFHLQQQHDRSVLYEGAVCGSIPIIRNLEEYYDNDLITSVEGIFNGSTNYILTRIFDDRKSYAEALREAQQLGFAESDPSLDVQGFDPKFKLAIILAHAFGEFVKPGNIINLGIDRLTDFDIAYAREHDLEIRLIARAVKSGNNTYGLVAPQFVERNNLLMQIRNEYNAVQVTGAFSEKQLFIGKGAGSYPTGSAVLSDISALRYGYRYEYQKFQQAGNAGFTNRASVEAFVRMPSEKRVPFRYFEKISSGYSSCSYQYHQGTITLDKLKELSLDKNTGVILSANAGLQAAGTTAVSANQLAA